MNKKAIYSILSVIVAMVVLSVSLVFAIGPKVSADGEEGIGVPSGFGRLDKAEYFAITPSGEMWGLTPEGANYASQFERLNVFIPKGVTSIRGRKYNGDGGKIMDSYVSVFNLMNDIGPITYGSKIQAVALPSTLTEVGDYAFYNCNNLHQIVIPESVTEIGEDVFDGCHSEAKILLGNNDLINHPNLIEYGSKMVISGLLDQVQYFNIDANGVLGGLSQAGQEYVANFKALKVVIPEGVVGVIGSMEQSGNDTLMWSCLGRECSNNIVISLVLPNSLKLIGENAFFAMDSLTELIIPNGVTSIGDGAFDMYGIASITIPASVTQIGIDIFREAMTEGFLNEIIVQNPDLMNHENLQPYASIMRYEAPQNIPEDPTDPEQPENPEQNQPETSGGENHENSSSVNKSKTDIGLLAGVASMSGVAMAACGFVAGFAVAKRRRK